MPKAYLKIRNKLIREGVPVQLAKKEAAIKYNQERKPGQRPVTRKRD
jgi:hypothetical protein